MVDRRRAQAEQRRVAQLLEGAGAHFGLAGLPDDTARAYSLRRDNVHMRAALAALQAGEWAVGALK